MTGDKSENLIQRIKGWFDDDYPHMHRFEPVDHPTPWMQEMSKMYRGLGDDLDAIADRTDETDTEQDLREIAADLHEAAEYYEGDNDE